jgi:hypothetical protein
LDIGGIDTMESEFKNKLEEFIQSENFTEKICKLLEKKGNKIEDGIVSMLKEFIGKEYEINFSGEQSFPDIILVDKVNNERYGIEVKTSQEKNILGNSIMESMKSDIKAKNLFMLLIKYKKDENGVINFDNAYIKNYFKTIKTVKITHSPRYILSLDREKGLFDAFSFEEIDEIRKDSGRILSEAYRKSGKTSFPDWFISFNEGQSDNELNLTSFESLRKSQQEKFISKVFIFCPQVFSNSPTKYKPVIGKAKDLV